MGNFFRILDALDQVPNRWHLGEPIDERGIEVDARDFTGGCRVPIRSLLTIPQVEPGVPLDFTFAAFDMPVVHRDVGALLQQIAGDDVQRIPTRIEDQEGDYEILNVTKRIKCIDENKTYVMKWKESDGRPDKVGQYRMIDDLHIENGLAEDSHLFRLTGWEVALICSSLIMAVLERQGVTGVAFREV